MFFSFAFLSMALVRHTLKQGDVIIFVASSLQPSRVTLEKHTTNVQDHPQSSEAV